MYNARYVKNFQNCFCKFYGKHTLASAMKVLALTISSVVIPNNFFGSYTLAFFKVSAATATVLFTYRWIFIISLITKTIRSNSSANLLIKIYRIRNDSDKRVFRACGNILDDIADNWCVRIEQIITGHSRFPWNTSSYYHNVNTLDRILFEISKIIKPVLGFHQLR